MTASVKSPAATNQADPILDDLLAEFANKLQAGEQLDLDAYAQEHPEHASALRRLLPAMQVLVNFDCALGSAMKWFPGGRVATLCR
jgi:hypothetical protein